MFLYSISDPLTYLVVKQHGPVACLLSLPPLLSEPADFIGPSPLTFPALGPGDRDRQCLAIVINDDPALEEDSEQFTIELLNSVLFRGVLFMADLPRSTVELNTTTVFIVDNDGKRSHRV